MKKILDAVEEMSYWIYNDMIDFAEELELEDFFVILDKYKNLKEASINTLIECDKLLGSLQAT